jgi:hypothetical protein
MICTHIGAEHCNKAGPKRQMIGMLFLFTTKNQKSARMAPAVNPFGKRFWRTADLFVADVKQLDISSGATTLINRRKGKCFSFLYCFYSKCFDLKGKDRAASILCICSRGGHYKKKPSTCAPGEEMENYTSLKCNCRYHYRVLEGVGSAGHGWYLSTASWKHTSNYLNAFL